MTSRDIILLFFLFSNNIIISANMLAEHSTSINDVIDVFGRVYCNYVLF